MRPQKNGLQTTRAWLAHSQVIGTRRIRDMTLNQKELEFLSAWAREEKARDPYVLPAHRLQATHNVRGVTFIRDIKAWARAEERRDEDIFSLFQNPDPSWP